MTERPTAEELAQAVAEFLEAEVFPTLVDHRLRFRTLVALNALGIVQRELARLESDDDTEQRRLAARIRAGDVPPGTLARVRADVEQRLRIASPRFLDQYESPSGG
jgi:hypothetical protein